MLPPFNERGDLPPGIHPPPLSEIATPFGTGTESRQRVVAKLKYIRPLANRTAKRVKVSRLRELCFRVATTA